MFRFRRRDAGQAYLPAVDRVEPHFNELNAAEQLDHLAGRQTAGQRFEFPFQAHPHRVTHEGDHHMRLHPWGNPVINRAQPDIAL